MPISSCGKKNDPETDEGAAVEKILPTAAGIRTRLIGINFNLMGLPTEWSAPKELQVRSGVVAYRETKSYRL
jgi:hypothetical protein